MGRKGQDSTSGDRARDELFSHIRRCGVLEVEREQREEWLSDTVGYLSERYPDLTEMELAELQEIGHRYCMPPISRVAVEVQDGPPVEESTELEGERGEVNAA